MSTKDEWRKLAGYIIILVGLLLSYVLGFTNTNHLTGLGIVGLGTFLSMLTGTFLITDKWTLDDGEFRKAITISIISVFFYCLAFGDSILIDNLTNTTITSANATAVVTRTNILGGLFTNFWAIVTTVVGFYFASRVIDNHINSQNGETPPPESPNMDPKQEDAEMMEKVKIDRQKSTEATKKAEKNLEIAKKVKTEPEKEEAIKEAEKEVQIAIDASKKAEEELEAAKRLLKLEDAS